MSPLVCRRFDARVAIEGTLRGSPNVRSRSVSLRVPSRADEHPVPVHAVSRELEPLDVASVYRRYAPYVAKIGMRILGRRDEVDDFVQDVFVTVHGQLAGLRDPAALKGWLATLAVREAMRRLRRRRVRALLGFGADRGAHDYADVADAGASPEQRALLARVFRALDALPADERVAWSLRHVENETMERVAELCGCSLSTAKRRVASAEARLAKKGVGDV